MKTEDLIQILEANGWKCKQRLSTYHEYKKNDFYIYITDIFGTPSLDVYYGDMKAIYDCQDVKIKDEKLICGEVEIVL